MRSMSIARLSALLLLAGIAGATADDYPSRPIRVLVPYAAGGPSDTGARIAAEALSRVLSKPVFVENRSGGGGLNPAGHYVPVQDQRYSISVGASRR